MWCMLKGLVDWGADYVLLGEQLRLQRSSLSKKQAQARRWPAQRPIYEVRPNWAKKRTCETETQRPHLRQLRVETTPQAEQ